MAAPKEGRGLRIVQRAEDIERERFVPDRFLTLTPDGRVVEEGAESGTLFGVPGRPIELALARRYGLVAEVSTAAAVPEVEVSTVTVAAAPVTPRRGRREE